MNKYKDFDWESIGFNFGNWEEELIWSLDIPVEEININNLLWHLDIPYWENDSGERWTVSPRDVINKEKGTVTEQKKVNDVDTKYPIDVFKNNGKYFVLDGLHRLVNLHNKHLEYVRVRIVPKERFSEILSEYPFELPTNK